MLVVESSRKIIVHNRPQYSAEESDTFPKAWSFGVSEAKEASRNLKALDLSTKKKKKSFNHQNTGLHIFKRLLLAALC